MPIQFITSNPGKFAEAKTIIPNLKQLKIDLPEIQELDPHKIIRAKLNSALQHHQGPFIVEDISLKLDCLSGLPGPVIKWFLHSMGAEQLAATALKLDNAAASAEMLLGYALDADNIHYFTGKLCGRIVAPRGKNGFGFDGIFQPDGYNKTLAEDNELKLAIGWRRQALEKLKRFLANQP